MDLQASDEDLFEDDVELVEISDNEECSSDTEEDEDIEPVRDDASLVFSKHNGPVYSIGVQPGNGSLAVSGAKDDMAYVWDVKSGEVLLTCSGHKDSVIFVGFNHDGTFVATGDMAGYLQAWNISNKSLIWKENIESASWVRWHPRSNVLLAAISAGTVYIWTIPAGDCKVLSNNWSMRSECGEILPDGERLAVGYNNGTLMIYDMKSSQLLHHVDTDDLLLQSIISMDSYYNSSLLLYGTDRTSAYMVKTQTGKVVTAFNCSDAPVGMVDGVEALGFCKDPSTPWAATGSLSGKLTIWDISREARRNEDKQAAGITKLTWLKTDLLITTGMDGIVRLYDGRSGAVEKEFHGHCRGIFDHVMTANNCNILTASSDKTVRIFNIKLPEEDGEAI